MPNKIDEEARQRSRLRIDVDKHRYIYQTQEVNQETDTNITINFISPAMFVYEHYKFFLLKNSVLKDIDLKYTYRPDYLSYDEYGTTILWTMILYLNNIRNIEEFVNIEKLYIPKMDAIYRIANDILNSRPQNVTPIIKLSKGIKARIFSKKSEPFLVEQPDIIPEEKKNDFYFIRQTLTIRTCDAINQFIDLNYEAIPQSISFKIKDRAPFIYDHDYILINNNSGKPRRISWNRRHVSGEGLLDIIEEGMILEIQYAKAL